MLPLLALIFKSLRYRPLRSWLTIFGIIIGIMLVVIILTLGDGIKGAVTRTLQMFGSDLIVILPGKETNPLVGFIGGEKFREQDLMSLEKIPGVRFVIPMEVETLNVEFQGEKKNVMIHANPWRGYKEVYEESQGLSLEQGRWPRDEDAKETVLGYQTARSLFQHPVRIGDELIIKSKRMKVVGIVSPVGEQMAENLIYISMRTYRDLTGAKERARSALVKAYRDADASLVARQIRHQLSKQEVVRDFSVLTPEKAGRVVGDVVSIIELVLLFVGLISLLVGAVGIMNTMYTSVFERTKQIGIMKAIGASNDAILFLFLLESGFIGIMGGIIGILLGILSAYGINLIFASQGFRGLFSFASIDYLGLAAVLMITFLTGILSGVLPARQAARMEPAEALRFE